MNTSRRARKKPGPAKRLPPMEDTHLFLPGPLLSWAKQQPEGCVGLVRKLLAEEYERRSTLPSQDRAAPAL